MKKIYGIVKIAQRFTVKGGQLGKSLKGKDLGKGITQRKNGLYQGSFVRSDGKRITLYSRSLSELKEKMSDDDVRALPKMTMDEWFEVWITECKAHCRDSTKRTYISQYNQVRPSLGRIEIGSVTKADVVKALDILENYPSKKNCSILVGDMLRSAYDRGLIELNPIAGMHLLKRRKHIETNEKRILTKEEIDILLEELSGTAYMKDLVEVALCTGMRIGELLGLRWTNVDFEKGVIRVEETLIHLPFEGFSFHPPKTIAGRRTIPMVKSVIDILEKRKALGTELVFESSAGTPLYDINVRNLLVGHLRRIEKAHPDMDLSGVTMHSFRHTFATNCIANGMTPKVLQKIMGHASIKMTMDLYCHVLPETMALEMTKCFENAV